MTVYIKREDAIDTVLDVYYNTPDIDLSGERLEAAILKVQPTYIAPSGRLRGVTYEDGKIIDVHVMDTDDVVKVFSPVVHAKWDANGRCTNCGGHAPFYSMASTYYESPYCFECGAKIDKEEP